MQKHRRLWVSTLALIFAFVAPARAFEISASDDPLSTLDSIKATAPTSCTIDVSDDKVLELADAVRVALCHNPKTSESWANLLTQSSKLGSARSEYLPSVNATVDVDRAINDNGSTHSAQSLASPGVSLDYLLFDFGARSANTDATKHSLIAADYTHHSVLQSVLYDAVEAYYQLFSAQSSVRAAEESLTSSQASMEAATFRHKVGAATIADQLQAETAYSQALLKLEQAKNKLQSARGLLDNVLGISPNMPIKLPSSAPEVFADTFKDSISDMLERAKRQRPDLAASAATVASSKSNIALQKARALPKITFNAGQQYDDVLSGSGSNRNSTTVGATLHIPLFTGYDRTYQIKAAEQQAQAEEARYKQAEDDVLLDLWNSYNDYDTANHTLNMTSTLLSSAEKSQDVAMGRYKAGAGTITELLNAQASLADAKQQRVSSEYSWMIAKANLLRALGQLTPDAVTNAPH